MRCRACDAALTNKEATRKYASTGEFLDLCDDCFETISEDIEVVDGHDVPEEDDDN